MTTNSYVVELEEGVWLVNQTIWFGTDTTTRISHAKLHASEASAKRSLARVRAQRHFPDAKIYMMEKATMTKAERDDLASLARMQGFVIYNISHARDSNGQPLMMLRKASKTYIKLDNGYQTKAVGETVLERANYETVRRFLLDRRPS